jgi:ATP-dependent RNA helicase MSS116
MSEQVKQVVSDLAVSNYNFIDCCDKDEMPTHLTIKQRCEVVPMQTHLQFLLDSVKEHFEKEENAKIIVFFPTTTLASYMASAFTHINGLDIIELHSRMDQTKRSKISQRFKVAKKGILFTTDVSARGVDYPNVTLVIQMGIPSNREQYIHRIGRTGRAGKDGEALLAIAPYEMKFLGHLKDLPIKVKIHNNYQPRTDTVLEVSSAVECVDVSERMSVFVPYLSSGIFYYHYYGNHSHLFSSICHQERFAHLF